MRMLQRCIVIALMVACLLPMQYGIAELAPDRAEFYRERTEEWENALGDYVRWDYYDRATFCAIYGRIPGDYRLFRTIFPNFHQKNASHMKKR